MNEPLRVLIVDDVRDYAEMLALLLAEVDIGTDILPSVASSYDEALSLLTTGAFDAALVDYWLDLQDGVALLSAVRERGVDTPVVILTGAGGEAIVAEVMKRGAADYLPKTALSSEVLGRSLRHALALRDGERQRRQAEAALRASEERFRALLENSSDALLLLDADGRVSFVTSSVERHLGWTPAMLLGRSAFDLVHPADTGRARRLFETILGHPGEPVHAELRVRHSDGTWRHMECVGVNRLADPAVGGIVVNARDATERRSLEDQLRTAQKMEAVGQPVPSRPGGGEDRGRAGGDADAPAARVQPPADAPAESDRPEPARGQRRARAARRRG